MAAFGLDEGSGSVAVDASGVGNDGVVSGAAWDAGRYGGGLRFDGTDDWVTIPDAASLDLRTGMTLAAWVRPTTTSGWRTVVLKEQPGDLVYALYSSTSAGVPSGHVWVGDDERVLGPGPLPANQWTHLAATYDGAMLRLFRDGAQIASRSLPGTVATSGGVLRLGGNAVWNEWFSGVIDEVRVYDRALTASEIARDRVTPVNPGVARRKAARHRAGGKTRRTLRRVHRGTRWLSGGGAAARPG